MSDFDEHEFELTGTGIELRTAGPDDHDLIRRTVALAANWRATTVPDELAPEVAKYHRGWGRPGDIGVLVFRGIEFAGGAYVRQFSRADGAYGYFDDDHAELTLGVEAPFRRRGLGVLLLAALKAKVLQHGLTGISLSVEPDNHARYLYAKIGFDLVEDRGNDLLMVWR